MNESIQILGIRFFDGTVEGAIEQMQRDGGFLVAPSGTCFARLREDTLYREAMTRADLAIPDSGAMVLTWKLLGRGNLKRISGLTYLKRLVEEPAFHESGRSFFVLPSDAARTKLLRWARDEVLQIDPNNCYVAPHYGSVVEDADLLNEIGSRRPDHIVIAIGSGPQEKLGLYLRDSLAYRPAIHCTGAALGFLTGDQVAIPEWADRFYLGWLLRLFAQPRIFIPRLARAAALPALLLKFGEELPTLKQSRI